jgi:2',3'-cyclic-nucleotide 2'-phosphodiesterase / 3'-nucleotidase
MKKFVLILSLIILSIGLCAVKRDTLYVLHTTDVHGNLLAYDYFKDSEADKGLSKIYTFIKEFRAKHKNVILLDGGDMIQGTPLTYLYNHVESNQPHPIIAAMNYMGYDAMTVGNHEIEQGLEVCNRLIAESDFPWLSANSILANGKSYFEPYTFLEVSGMNIAILGLTTPGIPKWLNSSVYEGIQWKNMEEISKTHIDKLKNEADLVIGLFHAGFEADQQDTDLPQENASGLVAENVPGFDVIFGGHSHQTFPEGQLTITDPTETLKLISGYHGKKLGIVKIITEHKDERIKIVEKTGWIQPVQEFPSSEEIDKMFEINHQKTLEFMRKEIAVTGSELSTENAYFSDNPLIDLINLVQLEVSDADLSFASCFNSQLEIDPGPVQVKDIFSLYPYENSLYIVDMTGKEIVEYLEFAARFFVLVNEKIMSSKEISGYNYDIAEGISYVIDVTEPEGSRIRDLYLISTGEPINELSTYTVALNSFRGSGGGGYLNKIGKTDPVIKYKSNQEIRNLIIEYLTDNPDFQFNINDNWQIITD